jgi:hypothetical protein
MGRVSLPFPRKTKGTNSKSKIGEMPLDMRELRGFLVI